MEQRAAMTSKERPPQLRDKMTVKEVSTQLAEVDSGGNKETDSQLFLRLVFSVINARSKRDISKPKLKCCR